MARALFRPNRTQIFILAASVAGALGFALAMRYLAIENTPLGLACDAGDPGMLCAARKTVLTFSQSTVFGIVALIAAAMNLMRPSIVLCLVGLACAGMGLVLYNTSPSALAVALLAFSLARPLPEPE
jgi:hypothetical protein